MPQSKSFEHSSIENVVSSIHDPSDRNREYLTGARRLRASVVQRERAPSDVRQRLNDECSFTYPSTHGSDMRSDDSSVFFETPLSK